MKNIISAVSQIFPFGIYPKITKQNIILPFYHAVCNTVPEHLKYLYPVRNIKTFENDLDFFSKYFKPISLVELKNIIHLKTKEKYFHLTFDDGLSEFYNNVAPILKQKGIPATIFLNTSFIDNKEMFYKFKTSIILSEIDRKNLKSAEIKILKSKIINYKFEDNKKLDSIAYNFGIDLHTYLKKNNPYLTSEQIFELKKQGFTFGSHSKNHPELFNLNIEEQINQVIESIQFLYEKYEIEDKVFAFPFTDNGVSKTFFESIFQTSKIDFTFGTAGVKKDSVKNNLQRIPMEKNLFTARKIIGGEYLYYIFKAFLNKNLIKRR